MGESFHIKDRLKTMKMTSVCQNCFKISVEGVFKKPENCMPAWIVQIDGLNYAVHYCSDACREPAIEAFKERSDG